MNNKGQSVLSEHVMVFFIVIAALVAMTVFVQRAFEGRIRDARSYIFTSVSSVCDTNCQAATGNRISTEYEPYYLQELSDVQTNSQDKAGQKQSQVNWSIGEVFLNSINESTTATSGGVQLPPECADAANPKPSYCP